jgi:hypothetical protein
VIRVVDARLDRGEEARDAARVEAVDRRGDAVVALVAGRVDPRQASGLTLCDLSR